MIIETKQIRETLIRLRPAAAFAAASSWLVLANALHYMQAEGWVSAATASGGYLLGMISAHAGFAAVSVTLRDRRMFIEEGWLWGTLSWLITATLTILGAGIFLELAFHKPPSLMASAITAGGIIYTHILRPEMVKLHRRLRWRPA